MTLKTCLERCLVVELRSIARRHNFRLQSLLKGDIVSQLCKKIPEIAGSPTFLATLSESTRLVLGSLLNAGGILPTNQAEARYGPLRKAIPGGIESKQPWGDGMATALDDLHSCGLVFRDDESTSGPTVQVPSDILELMRPTSFHSRVFRPAAPPAAASGVFTGFCIDLMLLASAVDELRPTRLVSGGISRRDLLRLNSHLFTPEEITEVKSERTARRFHFLRTLAEAMGLIVREDGGFSTGPALHEWLSRCNANSADTVIPAFLDPGRCAWMEWDLAPGLQWVTAPTPEVICAARHFLIDLLLETEPDEWFTLSSLIQAARARNSFLLRQPGDTVSVRCAQTGREFTARDWNLVEGAWVEAVIRGPLYWMGLVEVGRTRKGEVTCLQVHTEAIPILRKFSLGAHSAIPHHSGGTAQPLMNTTPIVETPSTLIASDFLVVKDAVAIYEDLSVEVSNHTPLQQWFQIERVCDLIERGTVSRYRISREKVRQMLQAGVTLSEILFNLGEHLPESVVSTISGWSNRFGQVRIFPAIVLTVSDSALMTELRSNPDISGCMEQPLGVRSCTILPNQVDHLTNLLRSTGEMPHVQVPPRSEVSLDTWIEIQHALQFWQTRMAGSGPSDHTCQAVDAIIKSRISEETPGDPNGPSANIALLEDAIRRKRTIRFDYGLPEDLPVAMVVLPRSIGQHAGVTYVSGYRKGGSCLDRFRVDQIRNIGPIP